MATITITMVNTGLITQRMLGVRRGIAAMPQLTTQLIEQVMQETVRALEEATPLGTGRTGGHLASSYTQEAQDEVGAIFTDQGPKFTWVTEGTASPILPVHARALYSPELPHPMLSVRGQEPNNFARRVFADVAQYVDTAIPEFVTQLEAIIES